MKKKMFFFKEVQEQLGFKDDTIVSNDVQDMLKIVNNPFVPEPTLFDGCPVLLVGRDYNDDKKDVFIIWQDYGIAVHRYPGRYVYWLLKFNSLEKFNSKEAVIISNGMAMYNNQNLIDYFNTEDEIASAIVYITNAYKAEQKLQERSSDIEDPSEDNEYYDNDEVGEYRYNPRSGREEHFPDWLGGMESEEEFWEH